jgi:hypothetical protein
MRNFDESFTRFPAHPLSGRIRCDQLWMRRFQRFELPYQRVEFSVGDLGRVQDVIQILVVPQLLAQGLNFVSDAGHV